MPGKHYFEQSNRPGIWPVLTTLTCWILFFFWLVGLYVRSGGSRGTGSSLEM